MSAFDTYLDQTYPVVACRICLNLDVVVYSLTTPYLMAYYEDAVGEKIPPDDNLPLYACFECAHLLKKLYEFRNKCKQGLAVLRNIANVSQRVTEPILRSLSRKANNLTSALSFGNSKTQHFLSCFHPEVKLELSDDDVYGNSLSAYDDSFNEFNEEAKLDLEIHDETKVKAIEIFITEDNYKSNHKRKKNELDFENSRDIKRKRLDLRNSSTENVKESTWKNVTKTEDQGCTNTKQLIEKDGKYKWSHKNWDCKVLNIKEQEDYYNSPDNTEFSKRHKFCCSFCRKSFQQLKSYNAHTIKHDKNFGDFECWLCRLRFKKKLKLQAHITDHANLYSCKRCKYSTNDLNRVRLHDQRHNESRSRVKCRLINHECGQCGVHFRTGRELEAHNRRHREDYLCPMCGENFLNDHRRQTHVVINHSEKFTQSGTYVDMVDNEGHRCEDCDIKFVNEAAYKTHFGTANRHASNTRGEQESASQPNQNRIDMKQEHWLVQVLTEEQQAAEYLRRKASNMRWAHPHKCTVCGKGFQDAGVLAGHVRRHDQWSGPYECSLCKYRFKWESRYKRHMESCHRYKFVCKRCGYVTITKGQTISHDKYHEGVRYTCSSCDMTFKSPNSYRTHLRVKHRSSCLCTHCGENFVNAAGLDAHTRRTHSHETERGADMECKACALHFHNEEAYQRHFVTSSNHAGTSEKFRKRLPRKLVTAVGAVAGAGACKRRGGRPRGSGNAERSGFTVTCDECGKEISHYKYVRHCKKEHPGAAIKKTFVCELCGYCAASYVLLKSHSETHNTVRYPCPDCGKSFKKQASIATHQMAVHKGIRQHACGECGKRYIHKYDMTMHYRRVHLQDPGAKRVYKKRDRRKPPVSDAGAAAPIRPV